MWPWVRRSWERALNAWLLRRALTRTTANLKPPRVAVTTIPLVVDIVEKLPVDLWVYYCVDDWSTWLEADNAPLNQMEKELLTHVNCCVAVNKILQSKLAAIGKTSYLLTHGVDWELWNNSRREEHAALKDAERPIVLQWGSLDQRLNIDWLLGLADSLAQGTVALVGPPISVPGALAGHPRIRILPAVPYHELPQLAATADVLIMAYRIHASVVASSPVKLKEYLMSAKPVIVPDIPEVKSWSDSLDIARSTEEFVRLVQLRCQTGVLPPQLEARKRLEKESWQSKATEFRNFVVDALKAVELAPE
jgi:glycosyltransferase involved in cell wall biosynthesis